MQGGLMQGGTKQGDVTIAGSLADRVILVVGANGGLGDAAARACAAAGATVVLLGRRVPKLTKLYDAIETNGGPTPALYPLDLAGATPDDYAELAASIEREIGRLDGILHCAAEFKGLVSLENTPADDWHRALHVNVTAPLLLTRACLPLLRARDDAAVVFVLDAAERIGKALWGGYAVAKFALAGLVDVLRDELASSSVRVHGLQPGPMRTGLRGKAYFAEDPARVPEPSAYAPACVRLLGPQGRSAPAVVHATPTTAAPPRLTVL